MQRHTALIPLSHDHQHALAMALRLQRAASRSDEQRAELVEQLLAFVRDELEPHFAQEEALLDVAVAADPEPALVDGRDQILAEHRALRERIAQLAGSSDAAADTVGLEQLGAALHDHVRFEERVVFAAMQDQLADVLDELAAEAGIMPR
jgi:hemerythrin-like domain-containing protein